MTVSLTDDKKVKFRNFANFILLPGRKVIRDVAILVGLMVAYSPGVNLGFAHFKTLERNKIDALARVRGNFDETMWISDGGREDIIWWLNSLHSVKPITRPKPGLVLFTDASQDGWGATCNGRSTGGRWSLDEISDHINILELRAILLGLRSFGDLSSDHIRIRTDNTTALAYVKNMGGTKSKPCNELSKLIWSWAEARGCWLSVVHIPGVDNVIADLRSRHFLDHLEWELSQDLFLSICRKFGTPDVDLFASRLNFKLPLYVSWEPDPGSWRTDAFSFSWSDLFCYCFPPFKLLPVVIKKVLEDNARAVIVAPCWSAHPWHPWLCNIATEVITFKKSPLNLSGQGYQSLSTENSSVRQTQISAYLLSKEC